MRVVSFTVTLAMIAAGSLLAGQAAVPVGEPAAALTHEAQPQELTADQQAVLRVLREVAHAQFKRDAATFRRLTADEFVHLDTDGSLTSKQEWLRIFEDEPQRATAPPEPLGAPLRLAPGMVVRVVGATAVVVTTPPSAVKEQSARVVTVLIKRGAGWQQLLVNRQVIQQAAGN